MTFDNTEKFTLYHICTRTASL